MRRAGLLVQGTVLGGLATLSYWGEPRLFEVSGAWKAIRPQTFLFQTPLVYAEAPEQGAGRGLDWAESSRCFCFWDPFYEAMSGLQSQIPE